MPTGLRRGVRRMEGRSGNCPAQDLYTYDIASLEAGDIILSTTAGKQSAWIRTATGSDFSHAMLYTNKTIVHAAGPGVFTINPQRQLFSLGQSVVLRVRQPHDCDLVKVCNYALAQGGARYTIPEAVLAVAMQATGQRALSPSQYCSRLVAQAYQSAGLKLVANADFCVPGQFLHSPALREVDGAVRLADSNEFQVGQTPDTLQVHQEHTFAWLEPARRLAKESMGVTISTILDALEFVRANRQYDDAICRYVEKSGYLDDAELDRQVNPHRYDADAFRSWVTSRRQPVEAVFQGELDIARDVAQNALRNWKAVAPVSLRLHQLLAKTHWRRLALLKIRLELIRMLCLEFGESGCEALARQQLRDLDSVLAEGCRSSPAYSLS